MLQDNSTLTGIWWGTEEKRGKNTGNERPSSGTRKAGTINKTTLRAQQAWAAVTAAPKHELQRRDISRATFQWVGPWWAIQQLAGAHLIGPPQRGQDFRK